MKDQTLTAYLTVHDANAAIEFYKKAFGAHEIMRMPSPDGQKIMHASLRIGESIFYLSDEFEEMGNHSPKTLGGATCSLLIVVEDADIAFKQAIDAGAKSLMQPEDMFWGDRYGTVEDPFGHRWGIAAHIEELTPEEMKKRSEEFFAQSI